MLSFLTILILISIVYVFVQTISHEFSSIINISTNEMFNTIFRRPFGTVGYYALGIMLSINYFEYTQAAGNKEMKKRCAYRFMKYTTSSRKH